MSHAAHSNSTVIRFIHMNPNWYDRMKLIKCCYESCSELYKMELCFSLIRVVRVMEIFKKAFKLISLTFGEFEQLLIMAST